MGLARDVHRGLDARNLPAFVEPLDDDGDAVRDLLRDALEDLLADELGHEEPHGLIGQRVGVEEERLLGEQHPDLVEQPREPVGALRADRDGGREGVPLGEGRDERQEHATCP